MESGPSQDNVLYHQGRNLMEKGDFVGALNSLTRSADIYPHFKTSECIGVCLLKQGNFSEAFIHFSTSVKLGKGKQSKPLFLLAKALAELNQIEQARESLNEALAINPDYKAARDLLLSIDNASKISD